MRQAVRLRRTVTFNSIGLLLVAGVLVSAQPAPAQQAGKKPNILVIWGDDIGV